MRYRVSAMALVVGGGLLLGGCATVAGSSSVVSETVRVPPQVDIEEWQQVTGGAVISLTPAESFPSLDDLSQASDLVVLARVVDQGPFLDHDLVATETLVEVVDTLKGDVPDGPLRLYTIGTPVYLGDDHSDIEGTGDPPLFDATYLLYLTPVAESMNADGQLQPVSGLWRATGAGHYVEGEDGVFAWDGDSSAPPGTTTLEEAQAALDRTG